MRGLPVHGAKRDQMPHTEKPGRAAHADPHRIAIVNSGHRPANGQALFSKHPIAKVRCDSEQHRKAAGVKDCTKNNSR